MLDAGLYSANSHSLIRISKYFLTINSDSFILLFPSVKFLFLFKIKWCQFDELWRFEILECFEDKNRLQEKKASMNVHKNQLSQNSYGYCFPVSVKQKARKAINLSTKCKDTIVNTCRNQLWWNSHPCYFLVSQFNNNISWT